MNELCANCGASLFSPQSRICVACEKDPRFRETLVGPLFKTWIYDKVTVPNCCVSCGTGENLEDVNLSYSTNERKTPFIFVALGWLLPGILKVIFPPRIMDNATEPDKGNINSGLKQCASCKHFIVIAPLQIDMENRRFQIVACQGFIDATRNL